MIERMVTIPKGWFLQGCIPEDVLQQGVHDELADARPQRRVYLSAYQIDKYPVTNADYFAYLQELRSREMDLTVALPGGWNQDPLSYGDGSGEWPVVGVTWYQARSYALHYDKMLPTEAQWERAARWTDGRKFPWGNTFDSMG